jgi:tetratricopeptide (TPR) repeat protein
VNYRGHRERIGGGSFFTLWNRRGSLLSAYDCLGLVLMTRTRRRIFLLGAQVCVVLIASMLRADSITLRDGKVVDGVIKQIDGGYDVTLPDGKHRFVATEEVKSIKISNDGKVTEGNARERLTSLQRSVDSERDIDRIVERYEQFISMNANTEAAKVAQTDLDEWRARKTKGMMKVGHRWLTSAERDAALVEAANAVAKVNALISADQIEDASATLRQLLEAEPDNVSFLYLTGVLQLRRQQFFEAKRSFDAVAERIENHAPTIVNLSVLAAQFKRWPQAVALLEQAMTLAPSSQEVLDDVLELQQLVPESMRRTAGFERLVKRSIPLETALQQRQSRRGLFRFGSQWVDQATLDKAKADREAYEKKKVDLEADYQQSQETIRKADEQIALTQRLISRMEADATVQGNNGTVIRRQYPPAYWDMQRDLDLLQKQRVTTTNHIADLRKQAEVLKNSEPKPPFAGALSPIDHRGVPVVLPMNATTQPTAEPADAEGPAAPTPKLPLPTTVPATTPSENEKPRGLFE